MIYAALINILDQITAADRSNRHKALLEALLQTLSLWHLTGFCESTPPALIDKVTQALTVSRNQTHRALFGIRPSEIKDRWPPPNLLQHNALSTDDLLIKSAIRLAYNLKKSHSSSDMSKSVFWSYAFKSEADETEHGINTYNSDKECHFRRTFNRMASTLKLIQGSRVASQVFDEIRLKGDSLADYKTSFYREIVEYHTALELIRNHEESAICQPILGELWSRIFTRIQNLYTQFAIYQNVDKGWCGTMARLMGLHCHASLLLHARWSAVGRLLDTYTSEELTRGLPSSSAGALGELRSFSLGAGQLALASPRSVLGESGGGVASGGSVEEEMNCLVNALLCMSPVAYARVARILERCISPEHLWCVLALVEMYPDGCPPSTSTAGEALAPRVAPCCKIGEHWLESRLGLTQLNAGGLSYDRAVWAALKLRVTPNCETSDAKWINVLTSLVGDASLQYAEGLLLVPDMLTKQGRWIYNPAYLDWVKESKEFITIKLTQLQMRSVIRAHSLVLRENHERANPPLEQLKQELTNQFNLLEAKAEQNVQTALDDLHELSESVMQLLRHMK